MQKYNYLNSSNVSYIEDLFHLYQQDPSSVDDSWRYFFEGIELSAEAGPSRTEVLSSPPTPTAAPVPTATASPDLTGEAKVVELISAYRTWGRVLAHVNPLAPPSSSHPLLDLSQWGLTSADMSKTFSAGRLIGMGSASLNEIIGRLKEIYCRSVGVEFTHMQNAEERTWLQQKMESSRNQGELDTETRKLILKRLSESETFERFLHTRYVAQKRFSIEGGEGLIPALDSMIESGAEWGAEEFIVGMAHRGRLNVLTHLFGKKPEYIFTEFEGTYKTDLSLGEGDVKYHMGFSADITTRKGKKVHLSLGSNPSHLEFINPVVEGVARAKQQNRKDSDRKKVVPVTIHGDAAFAGQGVCYETLNLSQLAGYGTGGTLHFIINNQVGFTTNPSDSRSTPYCTDLAKMLDVPIFHVNGDDAEALWFISQLAMEYRQRFRKDVFIDLICYRKHGHNEGDEPSFTQPLLYKKIKTHPSPREVYADRLQQMKLVSQDESQALVQQIMQKLTEAQAITKAQSPKPAISAFEGAWKTLRRPTQSEVFKPVQTAVSTSVLKSLGSQLNHVPEGFHLHPKLTRFLESRLKAIEEGKGLDWGNAEALSFATLIAEGHPVRVSGQDAERGTFSHRHSVLNDTETGEKIVPLNLIKEKKASYEVRNSHLSEVAVLGFEYGYSLADPNALVIWEAQFGDFANGAQVIIDQFISTSESKWQRMTGLTLLLPHGYEGQGPEHSSARLERFLQLCGRENMSVCNLTTPAQLFHALRRQVKRPFRKPLVIMSPKSLLRHPMAVSSLNDLSQGSFEEVLDDPSFSTEASAKGVKKVLLCTGKVYYDLVAERASQNLNSVAIVRVEQLYPWPAEKLAKILSRYPKAQLVWVQEEPRNMGAWNYVFSTWSGGLDLFREKASDRSIEFVGRDIGASPAVGSHKIHEKEQATLIQKALK